EMFETMGVELPTSTAFMIHAATWAREHGLLLIFLLATGITGLVCFLQSDRGRRAWSRFVVRVPLFGAVVRSVIFAQLCRIWGQLLDSKVGLVEAVELTRQSTWSLDFREMLTEVKQAITQGE